MCPCFAYHCILKGFIVIGLYCINKTFRFSEMFNGNKEHWDDVWQRQTHEHKICSYCPDCRTYVDGSQMCYYIINVIIYIAMT